MLVQTAELTEASVNKYAGATLDQIYNGLDCCVTLEVLEEIGKLTNNSPGIYDFSRALQAPALSMMLQGFFVDQYAKGEALKRLKANIALLNGRLQRMSMAVWDRPINPNSTQQLKEFFYGALHVPEVHRWEGGVKKLPMDRDTLEKLSENYLAGPIISAILGIREDERSVKVLETEIDSDNYYRTSYNIAATKTSRWSSSKNAEGTGGNLQNWKEFLRRVMTVELGWKIGAIDLEQADAREIGFVMGVLFDDWTYLNACESGDLHTNSSKLIWPELGWKGEPKADRALAETGFYRDFSYRDMSKRGGHAVTYVAQPPTISRHLKIPLKVSTLFMERFFGAYPSIPRLHLWTAEQLQTTHRIRTYWGSDRHFFGRANDDATLREAVAHIGQSSTALRMSYGVYRLWETMRHRVRLIGQLHDAVYFKYREEEEEEIMPVAMRCIEIAVRSPSGRTFVVPGEAKVGWNWSRAHDPSRPLDPKRNQFNPNGLMKWKGKRDPRVRAEGEVF